MVLEIIRKVGIYVPIFEMKIASGFLGITFLILSRFFFFFKEKGKICMEFIILLTAYLTRSYVF
jgi:hypothetical protein